MGSEFFTAKSKGGVVLLGMYFYVTFVVAMCCWIDLPDLVTPPSSDVNPTTGNNTLCGTLVGCAVVLTRLTLYDGTGGYRLGAAPCENRIFPATSDHRSRPAERARFQLF